MKVFIIVFVSFSCKYTDITTIKVINLKVINDASYLKKKHTHNHNAFWALVPSIGYYSKKVASDNYWFENMFAYRKHAVAVRMDHALRSYH